MREGAHGGALIEGFELINCPLRMLGVVTDGYEDDFQALLRS